MIDKTKLSPMMKHFFSIKKQYPDAIILYRLGDFYEMFFDDAVEASKILDIALTGRDCGLENRAPMCGVPHHAVDGYIAKLIKANKKVAICEQLSDPKESKGIVDRDVIRVITPGTVINEEMLEETQNNFLLSIFVNSKCGLSWIDLSTGELKTTSLNDFNPDELANLMLFISPTEIITNNKTLNLLKPLNIFQNKMLNMPETHYEYSFDIDSATQTILNFYKIKSLAALGIEKEREAISSLGALIDYLISTQKTNLSHIKKTLFLRNRNKMFVDYNTIKNLELLDSLNNTKTGSLLNLIDKTKTHMGARLLRSTIKEPLSNITHINNRLDAVEELVNNKDSLQSIREELGHIYDLERLSAKIAYGSILPRECNLISKSLKAIDNIKKIYTSLNSPLNQSLFSKINSLESLYNLLEKAIIDSPPPTISNGGFIRKNYNTKLDELKAMQYTSKEWLAKYEAEEKEKTDIKTLRIGYNKIFGYFLEAPRSQIDKIPAHYERRQTLVNTERYITPELKRMEITILKADDEAISIELEIYNKIKHELNKNIKSIQINAQTIAQIDLLTNFASIAISNGYTKPLFNKSNEHIFIKNGRHPVVESLNTKFSFIANDTSLDEDCRTMIITGPNMGGKSTYMRQVALISLMAHMGSFVSAEHVEICLLDRIFSRIGASDNLATGQSTFMVEMTEITNILNNATNKSLVILDEIGRGTSTLDGLSIAWAVIEHISSRIKAKTLVATHYHELAELENILDKTKNFHVLINEHEGEINFLYKLARGSTSKSFGIEVAEMAGVNDSIINRAKKILDTIGKEHTEELVSKIILQPEKNINPKIQMDFFDEDPRFLEVENIIKDTDLNNCTPIQALAILSKIKNILEQR